MVRGLALLSLAALGLAAGCGGTAPQARSPRAGIQKIKHVIIVMQENRSFDHYFGTLRGVRGFDDKQILTYPNGTNIFQQPNRARGDLGFLLPYHLTDQVDGDLDHSWAGDHAARNGGRWDN